jgi:hypothetical protein
LTPAGIEANEKQKKLMADLDEMFPEEADGS